MYMCIKRKSLAVLRSTVRHFFFLFFPSFSASCKVNAGPRVRIINERRPETCCLAADLHHQVYFQHQRCISLVERLWLSRHVAAAAVGWLWGGPERSTEIAVVSVGNCALVLSIRPRSKRSHLSVFRAAPRKFSSKCNQRDAWKSFEVKFLSFYSHSVRKLW